MKTISTLFFSKYLKLTYISSAYLVIIDISSELKDPIHWAFALLGVLIGFGARKVDKKNNLANSNLWWSLSVSIAFTLLMTFVRESYPNITNLWYYGLTLAVSTFSPAIVGNLLTYLPSSISKAFIGLVENWINSKRKAMALNFEALLQAISICLWLTLVVFAWAKKQYIGIVVSILVMTISAFIAFNLLYDLDLNNFQKGSSHLFWYPCNYMLVVIFYKLILKIEKTEDERG